MADEPHLERVKLSDLHPGPIRHESLSPEIIRKVDLVFNIIGPWVGSNREVFETNLMRDAHPDQEVNLWLRIAAAWHKYHVLHLGSQVKGDEEESRLVGGLVGISLGCGPQDVKTVTQDEYNGLLECYKNPAS